MTDIDDFFGSDYAAARARFLDACRRAGVDAASHINPESGRAGQELGMDVARIGDPKATRLLVLQSGVHGPELMCGSGCQTGLLRERYFDDLPAGVAVLLVHAVNPWGAAQLRRNTEDNVDLCRNFMDFDEPLPENPAYESLHGAFAAAASAESPATLREALQSAEREAGIGDFLSALMAGQYAHADGFSYGGAGPTWSNRVLTDVLCEHAANASRVVALDYHSGLGPYGYGSAVVMQSGEALDRAGQWFGDWVVAPRAESGPEEFYPVYGHCADGYVQSLPDAEVTFVTIEYGTYSAQRNFAALIDDHWRAVCQDAPEAAVRDIKQEMVQTHCPDDPEWRYAVWTRSEQVVRQAMGCLLR